MPSHSETCFSTAVLDHPLDGGAFVFAGNIFRTAEHRVHTLKPGQFREIEHNLNVNLVFVGYEQGSGPQDINEQRFRELLPGTHRGVARFPSDPDSFSNGTFYTGQKYTFSHNIVYADAAFENAFFGYLTSIAQPQPYESLMQYFYNQWPTRSLTVTDNSWIEGPAVEKWLGEHAGPRLGVNTQQHTVFLVNWHGRADFKFHEYVKTDEVDAETGYNFGSEPDGYIPEPEIWFGIYQRMMGWGGTAPDDPESGNGRLNRLWFFDLSAGPDVWTGSWDIESPYDYAAYRIPNVWEYGNTQGYRPFDDLSGDLARIVRYAAINQMFAASPIYDPRHGTNTLTDQVQLDVTAFQGFPGANVLWFFDGENFRSRIAKLRPLTSFSIDIDEQPYTTDLSSVMDCYKLSFTSVSQPSCFGPRSGGNAEYDIFNYLSARKHIYLEGDAAEEIPVVIFGLPDEQRAGLSGVAQWDPSGRQVFPTNFYFPRTYWRGAGIGQTAIHEVGHHLGMSHTQDGYDHEWNLFYGPWNDQRPAQFGQYVNSVMNYLNTNDEFGQFDLDSMNRYMTSVYINEANKLLGERFGDQMPKGRGFESLALADMKATQAIAAYQSMNYSGAASLAKNAYELVRAIGGPASSGIQKRSAPIADPAARIEQMKKYEAKYGEEAMRKRVSERLRHVMSRVAAMRERK